MKTKDLLPITLNTVVIDCRDIAALSDFYIRMLGWKETYSDEDWIDICSSTGGIKIGFHCTL